jgi:hypothetical protein
MADERSSKTPTLSTRVVTRRRHMRFDVLGQVEAHSVWRLKPILLREISAGGFSLESTAPFDVNVVYKFRLGIEGHKRSMIVQARAVHCTLVSISADLPIYVAGFEIVAPTEAVRREMLALVQYAESLWRDAGPA